jgi:hypothetical protein
MRQFLIKKFGSKWKFLDRRFSENISEKKKYAWFKDQYFNPYETKHTFFETINWFKESNIEYINSIPFSFVSSEKLFEKKLFQKNLKYFNRNYL